MAVITIKNIDKNLNKVIDYGKNGDKTEHGLLVSSINCAVETCYEEMMLIKKFYHNEDGVQGYHFIQSFNGFETSPEKANRIGKELAEEMWGDKYQAIVCTHVNTKNVHNHIILQSVSFKDGKKYRNNKTNIDILRSISDRLCLENGLSVINTPKANKEKEIGQKRIDNFKRTDKNMQKAINDIDDAVKSAKTYSDFKLILKAKGYSNIKDDGKYFSLKTPYFSQNVRIDKVFGDDYSVQAIKEKIYRYRPVEMIPVANYNKKYYKKVYKGHKIDWNLYKCNRFYRWYLIALYILGFLPAKVEIKEVTATNNKVSNKVKMKFEELNYINRSHSKSIEDIKTHKKEIEDKLPELKVEIENLWVKYKKVTTSEEKESIRNKIDLITDEICTIGGERKACIRIIDTYKLAYKKFEQEKAEQEKFKDLKEKSKTIKNK